MNNEEEGPFEGQDTNSNNISQTYKSTLPQNKNVYQFALKYLESGLSVIPLQYGKKIPAIDSWKSYQERQPTKEEVGKWFDKDKLLNVAIICGRVSGNLKVYDFDDMKTLPFVFDLEKLRKETRVVRTTKGYHIYFRGNSTQNTTRFNNLGIDIKGEGGYVAAPPSLHPSGIEYEDIGADTIAQLEDSERDIDYMRQMDFLYPIGQILLKYWREGNRHEITLRLTSFLRQVGQWNPESIRHLIQGVMRLADDRTELEDRKKAIEDGLKRDYPYDSLPPELLKDLLDAGITDYLTVTVSESDKIYGRIKNGPEGYVARKQPPSKNNVQGITTIIRFNGAIGPIVKLDDDEFGIEYSLLGEKGALGLDDFMTFIKHRYSLKADFARYLREILEAWTAKEIKEGKTKEYYSSPITVVDNVVVVKKEPHDIAPTLRALRDYYQWASHQTAYVSAMGWTLIAPLHYELKKRSKKGIQTPWMLEEGKTRGGKTALGVLFIGKGYGQDKDQYFLSYERVRTPFMLKKHLRADNLPKLLDDVQLEWLFKTKESLKTYVQTGIFAELGRSDQTSVEYRGKASGFVTINDERRIDDDLALSLRLHVDFHTDTNASRKDKTRYDALFDSLPDGFMTDIFASIFANQSINDILRKVETFEGEADWVNYGIDLINEKCKDCRIELFPKYDSTKVSKDTLDNALELAQAFLSEWKRIDEGKEEYEDRESGKIFQKWKYRSPIENEFKIEPSGANRYRIYFQGSAYKALVAQHHLQFPFQTAASFLNNILSRDDGVRVEYGGKLHTTRIGIETVKCYCISIPMEMKDSEGVD
jgi:hypothetical protein